MQNALLNPTGQKDTPSPVQTTDFGTVVSARSVTAPRRSNAACVMCAKARPQGKLSYSARDLIFTSSFCVCERARVCICMYNVLYMYVCIGGGG